MRLSIIHRSAIDAAPDSMAARMEEDLRQHGLTIEDLTPETLARFKDLGLVEYEGKEYYASLYNPPEIEDEEP